MSNLNKLQKIADEQSITVIDINKPNYRRKGVCMSDVGGYAIALINQAQISSTAQEACVLGEEIGHISTNSMLPTKAYINSDYYYWIKQKNERRAKRWAVDHLLPPESIHEAIAEGCSNNFEIAQFCNVEEEFLEFAFEHYARNGIRFDKDLLF